MITSRALVLLLAALAAACKRPAPTEPPDAAPPPPPDHLATGEVVAGTEMAFGLTLPRASRVVGRYTASVVARSPLSPEVVSNFIRARVKGGRCIVGATSTVFDHVVLPSAPERQLNIDIRLSRTMNELTLVTIDDVTTPPPATSITPDEGWRRAGRTPDGKLIAPSRLE